MVRVHSDLMKHERIPEKLKGKSIWQERFEDIRNSERYLTRNGIIIRKFFLNLSKKEQKRRFLERLDTREKNWKFSAADASEREYWDDYMNAYEQMIASTSKKHAPWYVVPADNKWYTRMAVAAAIVDALDELKLSYPKISGEQRKQLMVARKELERKS